MTDRKDGKVDGPFGRTLLLLFICFVFAQADKQVLSLIAEPLKRDLVLSDTQLGLLQGLAFSLFYALAGVPISRAIDRGNRVRIAACCVLLWSAATAACGLAGSFVILLALRAGTAVAEAGLPPAAFSIFSERPSPRQVARASSIFMLGPFFGVALALVGGGAILRMVAAGTLFPAVPGWRTVLVILGLLGGLCGLALALFVREPARHSNSSDTPSPPLLDVIRAMFPPRGFFRAYYAALTVFTIYLYAVLAWYPVLLIRSFHASAAVVGTYAGFTYLGAGLLGTLTSTIMASRTPHFDVRSAVGRFFISSLVMLPVAIAIPLVTSFAVSIALYACYAFLSATVASLMIVPMQLLLPNRMQARSVALYSLCTAALGGSFGPLLVGILADRFALPAALEIVSATTMVICTGLFWVSWRRAEAPV